MGNYILVPGEWWRNYNGLAGKKFLCQVVGGSRKHKFAASRKMWAVQIVEESSDVDSSGSDSEEEDGAGTRSCWMNLETYTKCRADFSAVQDEKQAAAAAGGRGEGGRAERLRSRLQR